MEHITMNKKEREQIKVFELVKQGIINKTEAAAKLRISVRWVREKIKRYINEGDIGITHKNRGKVSNRCWDKNHEKLLIELFESEWKGFGPTFTTEKLKEIYNINVSKETVRKVLTREGFWQAKQQKIVHRARRERKSMLGIMVQLDGSPHDWFEGRGPECTLLVFIDDATSKILWLEFATGESVEALMQATKNYVEKNGIPQSFYTDHGSVFHVNLNNIENYKKTQWEQAIALLGIEVIHANSPQAKGRVERCNGTLQDRLIKEMRLAKISSIEAANNFLRTNNFIEKHNNNFSVSPTQSGDAHKSVCGYDLNDVFCIREKRILANDFTIIYNKEIFQLLKQQKTILRPKDEIIVCVSLSGFITLQIRKTKLDFIKIESRPSKTEPSYKPPCKPSKNSRRWAYGSLYYPKVESSPNLSMEMSPK